MPTQPPEQLTERYCVLVNGHAVEPGCWVDGHWGQYGPDHLADRAEELGWEPAEPGDDPRQLRSAAEAIAEANPLEPWCEICRNPVEWRAAPTEENPRLREAYCTNPDGIAPAGPPHVPQPTWPSANLWEQRVDADDAIVAWLNEHTETEGYSWGWHDGEFYLWPTETWEESD